MKKRSRLKKVPLLSVLFLLLLLVLNYMLNQHAEVTALIKRSNEQTTHIQKLESQLNGLEGTVAYEDKQIQALGHTKTQLIDNTNKEQVYTAPSPLTPQTIIVSVLVTLGGLVKTLVPSF